MGTSLRSSTRHEHGRRGQADPHRPESRTSPACRDRVRRAEPAAFDAMDAASLGRFFRDLPDTIGHVMVTAGRPHYGRLMDLTSSRRDGPWTHTYCSYSRSPASGASSDGPASPHSPYM